MSVTEVILLITTVSSLARWWVERRDARSVVAVARTEADKTVSTLTSTVSAKNDEINEIKEDRDFWRSRAEHLESLLYVGGQR